MKYGMMVMVCLLTLWTGSAWAEPAGKNGWLSPVKVTGIFIAHGYINVTFSDMGHGTCGSTAYYRLEAEGPEKNPLFYLTYSMLMTAHIENRDVQVFLGPTCLSGQDVIRHVVIGNSLGN